MNVGVMSLVIFIGGVCILLYGVLFLNSNVESRVIEKPFDTSKIDQLLSELNEKTLDADKMMVELDKFAVHVQEQNDKKYKELMMLYKLIDEKKEEILNREEKLKEREKRLEQQEVQLSISNYKNGTNETGNSFIQKQINFPKASNFSSESMNYNAPKMVAAAYSNANMAGIKTNKKKCFDEVIYMYESGKSIDEIAKDLGKGKGEIRLMLDLVGKEE